MESNKAKLQRLVEEKGIHKEGINFLLEYYMHSLHWSENESVDYIIKLFENGTIDDILIIGGKDNGQNS
jgi:hypothetical protein